MELFCTDDGEVLDVSMGDLQMLLGGLGEGLYENVVSSRQQTELSADLWKSLENYLLNMETVQEEQTDVETAVKLLEERSQAARANGRRLEKERHQREQELNSQIRYVEQRESLLQEKIAQMEAQRRELAQEQAGAAERVAFARECCVCGLDMEGTAISAEGTQRRIGYGNFF